MCFFKPIYLKALLRVVNELRLPQMNAFGRELYLPSTLISHFLNFSNNISLGEEKLSKNGWKTEKFTEIVIRTN